MSLLLGSKKFRAVYESVQLLSVACSRAGAIWWHRLWHVVFEYVHS